MTGTRPAARFLKEDLAAGYPKIGFELAAMGWNNPRFRERAAAIVHKWREVLTGALRDALREYRLDPELFPLEGVVSLVLLLAIGATKLIDRSTPSASAATPYMPVDPTAPVAPPSSASSDVPPSEVNHG